MPRRCMLANTRRVSGLEVRKQKPTVHRARVARTQRTSEHLKEVGCGSGFKKEGMRILCAFCFFSLYFVLLESVNEHYGGDAG